MFIRRQRTEDRRRNITGILTVLFMVILAPDGLQAQDISASMSLQNPVIYTGEEGVIQVTVSGTGKGADVRMPEVAGLEFRQGGTSSQTSIINGNMSVSMTYTFYVRFEKEGQYTVPGASVSYNGKTIRTNGVRLVVSKPPETDVYKISQKFTKSSCYVFEPVIFEFTIYASRSITGLDLSIPFLREELGTRRDVNFKFDLVNGRQDEVFAVSGFKLPFTRGSAKLEDSVYTTYTTRLKVTPLKAGTYHFGSAGGRVQSDEVKGYTNDIFRRRSYKVYRVAVDPLDLEVSDVPSAGRPAGYTGAVGQLHISLRLSSAAGTSSSEKGEDEPLKVYTAEPLTLEFSVGGTGVIEKLNPPDFKRFLPSPAFTVSDDVEGVYDEKTEVKTFTATVRVLEGSVTSLPSIEYPFFDVDTKEFRTASTKPVPLEVIKTEIATAKDVVDYSGGSSAQEVKGKTLKVQEEGLADNYRGDIVVENDDYRRYFSPGFYILLILPVAVLILNAGAGRLLTRKKGDSGKQLKRRALKNTLPLLKKAMREDDWYNALGNAVRQYCGDVLSRSGDSLTPDEISGMLRTLGAGESESEELARILSVCDAGRYGGSGSEDKTETVSRTRQLLKNIHRSLKKMLVLFLVLLFFSCPAFCADDELSGLQLSAEASYRKGLESLRVGDVSGARKEFRKALIDYKSILKSGVYNGYLYYNLGNCSMRLENTGDAVYYYRMAMKYLPRDSRIRENYSKAVKLRKDVIIPEAEERLFRSLVFWHYQTGMKSKMIFALVMSLLCMVSGIIYLYLKTPGMRALCIISLILFLVSSVSGTVQYRNSAPGREGVIIADAKGYRTSAHFSEKFESSLHEGTEFSVIEQEQDTVHIRLEDGRDCWIPASATRLLE